MACLAVLCCIWEPVKEALLGFLGNSVIDSLSFLRDRAVEEVRSRTVLWGNRIQRLPSSTPSMVGREQLLSDIQGLLKGDVKGIIGLYGMGGVGKTTLLKEINNQLLESRDNPFDVVVWVTVSKDTAVFKIQEDVGVRLGFSRVGEGQGRQLPRDEHDRRLALHQALLGKKFLLLLDDMWEALDLENVGVPHPNSGNNKGKIVFTTRSTDVCADMDADAKVRVGCLNETGSWELFCSKVGDEVDLNKDPVIRLLAESVVRKCGGVPLALITVGRAMSVETSIREWEKAVLSLSQSPKGIRGMEKHVLSVLKFSFDRLVDESTKQCLLYCSLFPEDHIIHVDKLIELWVGEGFLDSDSGNHTSLYEARTKGESIIKTLKNACLLEDGGYTSVRLHDLVREMALWLTEKTYKAFVLQESHQKFLGGSAEVEGWEDAKRISVKVQAQGCELPCPGKECPNLVTFLVFEGYSCCLSAPQSFIQSMQALRVLDLSTNLKELPSAIGLLVELRHLNLQWTRIRRLPKEMGQLVKLRHLNLGNTNYLLHVPRAALITLRSLQSLNLIWSGYDMALPGDDGDDERDGICLRDLDCNMDRLEELGVDIFTSQCLRNLVDSKKFQRCTRKLHITIRQDFGMEDLSVATERLENLEYLHIISCTSLEGEWRVDGVRQLRRLRELHLHSLEGLRNAVGDFPCLQKLLIANCPQLKDLNWVGRLPRLEELIVFRCNGIVELLQLSVGDEPGDGDGDGQYNSPSFPMLREMKLSLLPALTSISKGMLLFPSLEKLSVRECWRLKRLPLGLDSGKKIRKIVAEQEWWDALEWDNRDTQDGTSIVKSAFAPYFLIQ